MDAALQISGLTKRYGHQIAVHELDLTVPAGSVYGILGPNGSGKTSTLGVVLGVLNAEKGSYNWFGQGSGHLLRRRIGALLEQPNLHPGMSARDNLRLAARIKNVSEGEIGQVLQKTGLAQWKHKKYRAFSTGMKQRLALASALLGDPEVLVLDEPTNGLDPEGIADVRNVIRSVADSGKTVVLASHLLDEVQKLCTHVAVLKEGRKIFDGPVGDMLGGRSGGVSIGASDRTELLQVLQAYQGVDAVREDGHLVTATLARDYTTADLSSYLISRGIRITHISEKQGSLEQEFIKLLGQ
jgi:ABC-2 type transport system ATP-binding protein